MRGLAGRPALSSRAAARPPRITVRDARLDAFVRVAPGYSLVARAGKLTVDWPGAGSAQRRSRGHRGGPARAAHPGGPPDPPPVERRPPHARWRGPARRAARRRHLARPAEPAGIRSARSRARLAIQGPAPDPSSPAPALTARFELGASGAHGTLEIPRLGLGPLRPLVRGLGIETGTAQAGLKLVLAAQPDGRSHLWLDLDAENLGLAHARLDRSYWGGLDLSLRGQALFDPASGRLEVERNELACLGLPLRRERMERAAAALAWRLENRNALRQPTRLRASAARSGPRQSGARSRGWSCRGRLGLAASLSFDSASWEGLGLCRRARPRCRVEREPAALEALLRALNAGGGRAPRLARAAHRPGTILTSSLTPRCPGT